MNIEQAFDVPASPAEAYALMIDLERVGGCIPGGEVGPRQEDGSHLASIAVKVGPMRMTYKGKVQIAEADEAAHRAVLQADVREQRGQGTAKAKMSMSVSQAQGGSRVETVTDVTLTGRAAHMGQGIIAEVADRLVADMASCIASKLNSAATQGTGAVESSARDRGAESPKRDRGAESRTRDPGAGSSTRDGGTGSSARDPESSARDQGAQSPPRVGDATRATHGHATTHQTKSINGLSLLMRVLWERVKRAATGKGG